MVKENMKYKFQTVSFSYQEENLEDIVNELYKTYD